MSNSELRLFTFQFNPSKGHPGNIDFSYLPFFQNFWPQEKLYQNGDIMPPCDCIPPSARLLKKIAYRPNEPATITLSPDHTHYVGFKIFFDTGSVTQEINQNHYFFLYQNCQRPEWALVLGYNSSHLYDPRGLLIARFCR